MLGIDMHSLGSNYAPGTTIDPRTGQAVGMGVRTGGGSYSTGLASPYADNARNAANAGYNTIGTGYLYGVGGQTLADQSKTYTPGAQIPGGTGNIQPGQVRDPGQTTWDQWAQRMQSNYNTPSTGGSLGNIGGTKSAGGPTGTTNSGYPTGYTGYGNSHIANGVTPTTTVSSTPAPTGNPSSGSSVPMAPAPSSSGGGLSAIQQLINQANRPVVRNPQTPITPLPSVNLNLPGLSGPLIPPTNPTVPLAPAPVMSNLGNFVVPKPRANNL